MNMPNTKKRICNLIKQKEDNRDHRFSTSSNIEIDEEKDLRDECPPIFDQGNLGSCTGQAGVAADMMENKTDAMLSRLYLYYKERELEGTISVDSGATMRSICKVLKNTGVCKESLWKYVISKFSKKPPEEADTDAPNYKIDSYVSLYGVDEIKQYISLNNSPVLIGMRVYDSFYEVDNTGIVSMPNTNTENNNGGHAVLIVGYTDFGEELRNKQSLKSNSKSFLSCVFEFIFDIFKSITGNNDSSDPEPDVIDDSTYNNDGYFIVRNSWGTNWGDNGYFYLPYDFVSKEFAFDAWALIKEG